MYVAEPACMLQPYTAYEVVIDAIKAEMYGVVNKGEIINEG